MIAEIKLTNDSRGQLHIEDLVVVSRGLVVMHHGGALTPELELNHQILVLATGLRRENIIDMRGLVSTTWLLYLLDLT